LEAIAMLTLPFRSLSNRKPNRSKSCRPRIEWMEPKTLLSAVTWTGDGGDNNWDTAANWSTDSVPGSGDDVTIDVGANIVHSDNVNDSINSLTSNEPLTISGGTLSIAAASTIDNTLSLTGGTLTGTGNLSVSGLVTLTTGTLSGGSQLNANGGILINAPNQGLSLAGRTINNPVGQTATWTGGNVLVTDDAVFNNLGTFTASGVGSYNENAAGDDSSFNNMGTFTTSGSSGFTVPFNMVGGSFDLTGDATASLESGTSTGGAFSIASEASLGLGSTFTAYTVDPTTTISGTGSLSIGADPSMVLPANYAFAGSTDFFSGVLQVDGSLIGTGITVQGGTLSGTGTVGAMSVGQAAVSPGDGSAPGILNVQGPADFVGNFDDEEGQEFSTFTPQLNGSAPGSGYGQLNVSGGVDLAEVTLNPSLGFTPTTGEQFTIITSTAPVVGTFQGLPEGASLTIGNTAFTVSYNAEDGNNVVLTQAGAAGPTVTGVHPDSGPSTGGIGATITGTDLDGATAVFFGSHQASNLTFLEVDTISVLVPPGSGTVDVTVVTPNGTTPISQADQFTYIAVTASAPSVSGVSPNSGPASGGTSVTITGSGFTGETGVEFGTTAATDVVFVSDTEITADSPAGSGVQDVTVITPAGTSATSSADRFTYTAAVAAAPSVTGVSPNSGPASGGTVVTITGTGFTGATAVDFGTTLATGVTVVNATTITALSPAGTGVANVTVTTPGGTSATSAADQFTYNAAPSVVSVQRFGFHMQPTSVVLTFSSPLDATLAENVSNYRFVTLGGYGKYANLIGHVTAVRAAVYDAATYTVTLYTAQRLNIHNLYRLTVNGTTPKSVKGSTGMPLAGEGKAGTNYVKVISGKLLAGPAPSFQAAHRLLKKGPIASAGHALSHHGSA
jgi:hypothetical protein